MPSLVYNIKRQGDGSMKRSVMIIMNPKAGKGNAKTALFTICDRFCAMQDEVHVYVSQYPSHAMVLSQELGSYHDILLCIGGDGTWNEVINGVMSLQKQPLLAYLPTGTVNDFASSLKMSKNPTTLMDHIETYTPFACDIGDFNHQRYFTYVAAFGLFTDVSYSTPQRSKNTFGKIAYYLEGIKQLASIPRYHIKLHVNDEVIEDDYIFGCISNSKYVAGFTTVSTKNAQMDDGLFEILMIRTPNNPLDVQVIIAALLRREVNHDWMYFTTATSLTIESKEAIPWTLDGEEGGSTLSVEIENKSKAVTILV